MFKQDLDVNDEEQHYPSISFMIICMTEDFGAQTFYFLLLLLLLLPWLLLLLLFCR